LSISCFEGRIEAINDRPSSRSVLDLRLAILVEPATHPANTHHQDGKNNMVGPAGFEPATKRL
jgi:hypothetical protein